MKYLIEKIIGLIKYDGSTISYNKALDDVFSLIKDHESKEFNPLELGFEIGVEQYSEEVLYLSSDSFILFDKIKKTYTISSERNNPRAYLKRIKIPNHRQGVELLRNLGVIE